MRGIKILDWIKKRFTKRHSVTQRHVNKKLDDFTFFVEMGKAIASGDIGYLEYLIDKRFEEAMEDESKRS